MIAIDEFQQILNYPEKNVEALLRTSIQHLKHVHFIFCGSDQAIMHELFNSAKRPFYASAKEIHLQKISSAKNAGFIRKHFERDKVKISWESIDLIDLTFTHIYFTQHLCHKLYAEKHKVIKPETVLHCMGRVLTENEGTYYQYRNLLTPAQWQLLKAIATEEKLTKPYSKDFISKFSLGSAAIVKRGLDSLLQKQMVYHPVSTIAPYYEVQDKFLLRWLQRK